jgi:hypothetical protein
MRANLGWLLQLLGMVVTGAALLIGLGYGVLRAEVFILAIGGGLFLLGRYLASPHRG